MRGPWSDDELRRAPYGLDWDTLHLANSRIGMPPPPFDTLHTSYYDPYRHPGHRTGNDGWFDWKSVMVKTDTPSSHRAIIPCHRCIGLAALAVSFKGAQRMLYELSWTGLDRGLDHSIQKLLADGKLSGWTVAPPIMGVWTVGDKTDSDIQFNGAAARKAAGSKGNMGGKAANIAHSGRKAMGEMLAREPYWQLERFGLQVYPSEEEDWDSGDKAEEDDAEDDDETKEEPKEVAAETKAKQPEQPVAQAKPQVVLSADKAAADDNVLPGDGSDDTSQGSK